MQPPQQNPAQAAPVTASTPPPRSNPNSTQNTMKVAEIRDGLIIMQDGSYRAVIMAQSINFDLMSPQEQEAVESSYQGFLIVAGGCLGLMLLLLVIIKLFGSKNKSQ
mgnify:CR=1 FL=1